MPAPLLLVPRDDRATPYWEVEAAIDVLDVGLALCLPMCQGWLVLVGVWLRDCVLQCHVMEITVGILSIRRW